jgi:hypothetical protein
LDQRRGRCPHVQHTTLTRGAPHPAVVVIRPAVATDRSTRVRARSECRPRRRDHAALEHDDGLGDALDAHDIRRPGAPDRGDAPDDLLREQHLGSNGEGLAARGEPYGGTDACLEPCGPVLGIDRPFRPRRGRGMIRGKKSSALRSSSRRPPATQHVVNGERGGRWRRRRRSDASQTPRSVSTTISAVASS